MAEKKKLTRRQFLQRAILAGSAIAFTDALIEPELLKTTHVTTKIKGLGKNLAGYRIGLISDVHYPRAIADEYISSACQRLVEARADVAVLPGDFIDGKYITRVPSMKGIFDPLAQLPDGVYGVLGNHDHWFDAEGTRKELANSTPVELIECKHVIVERNGDALAIGGIGDL